MELEIETDSQTFARRNGAPSRRRPRLVALCLLGAALVGLVLPIGGVAAQRPDGDGDGLFDDDEDLVYGTNPFVYDTDGDGSGDGQEVYDGTDPLDGFPDNGDLCYYPSPDGTQAEACTPEQP